MDALGIPNDSDVNVYGITNNQLWNGVDDYGIAIIGAGLFNPLFPIYLAIGGTAATHKINYTNPVDTDAAHRLTFFGGWTHDENGMTANGVNAYADTHFVPLAKYGIAGDNSHHSNYESSPQTTFHNHGCFDLTGANTRNMLMGNNTVNPDARLNRLGGAGLSFTYTGSGLGSFIISKNNEASTTRLYHNGVDVASESVPTGTPNRNYYIGARNGGAPSAYYNGTIRHFTIGLGVSAAQAATLHNAAHAINTLLNRPAAI
jgi:hypothetical protein